MTTRKKPTTTRKSGGATTTAKTPDSKKTEEQQFDPSKVDFSPINNATKVLQEALNKAQGAGLFKTLDEATEVQNAAALLENVSRMALQSGAVRMERSAAQ